MLGNSVSDFNAIDASTFNQVKKAKSNLKVESFKEPVELLDAFKNDRTKITSLAKDRLTFTIYLPGFNVPVRVRGVEFIIVNDEMDEILLGRPFLNKIGFDLNDHLRRIHPLIHGKHVDQIDPDKVRRTAAKYKGMSYMSADDDPIKLPECLAAGIGRDSEEAISRAFQNCISEAKTNSLLTKGLTRVRNFFKDCRDVLRIKLGPDPPADVNPLVITPVDNCKPYRSPQRRYAPPTTRLHSQHSTRTGVDGSCIQELLRSMGQS